MSTHMPLQTSWGNYMIMEKQFGEISKCKASEMKSKILTVDFVARKKNLKKKIVKVGLEGWGNNVCMFNVTGHL